MSRGRGAPSFYSDEMAETIADLISAGLTRRRAAQAVGIAADTLWEWLRRGRNGDPKFVKFAEMIKKADARGEGEMLSVIRESARNGTWQAAAWVLERKFPQRYGKRDRLEVTAKSAPVEPGQELAVAESVVAALKSGKR